MIANFEEITRPLSLREKKLFMPVYDQFKAMQAKNETLTNDQIIFEVNERVKHRDVLLTGVILRKIVHILRAKQILPVIGTSKGYYIASEQSQVVKQIESLQNRIDALKDAQNGLRWMVVLK